MSSKQSKNETNNVLGYLAFFLLLFTLFAFNLILKFLFGYGPVLKTLTSIGYVLTIICGILSFIYDYQHKKTDQASRKNGNFAGVAIIMALYLILVSFIKF